MLNCFNIYWLWLNLAIALRTTSWGRKVDSPWDLLTLPVIISTLFPEWLWQWSSAKMMRKCISLSVKQITLCRQILLNYQFHMNNLVYICFSSASWWIQIGYMISQMKGVVRKRLGHIYTVRHIKESQWYYRAWLHLYNLATQWHFNWCWHKDKGTTEDRKGQYGHQHQEEISPGNYLWK